MEQNTNTAAAAKPASRMEQARVLFKANMVSETPLARKDLLALMVKEVGISVQCAATYYQNIRRELGMEQGRGVKTQVETVATTTDASAASEAGAAATVMAEAAAEAVATVAETTEVAPEAQAEPAKRSRKKAVPAEA